MAITVFTPTFNRGDLLVNLYNSLKNQSCKDFEWIIVDDESTDNTCDVINGFLKEKNEFEIISLKQAHGGKHRAINLGVKNANYEWFFIVDSDDTLTDDAIEWIISHIKEADENSELCGISGTRVLKSGKRIDGELLLDDNQYADLYSYESYKINAAGDMAEVWKTKLLKKYRFPDYKGEYMCPEGLVWNTMAVEGYKVRYFNKPIYVFEYLEGGLTRTSGLDRIYDNFNYFCDIYRFIMKYYRPEIRIANFWNYVRVAHRKKIKFKDMGGLIGLEKEEFLRMYFVEMPIYIVKRAVEKVCERITRNG